MELLLEGAPHVFKGCHLFFGPITHALDLVHRRKHLIHDRCEILHVKPYWRDKECEVYEHLYNCAPHRIAPHCVQHLIVLPRQSVNLFQIRFHTHILPLENHVARFVAIRILIPLLNLTVKYRD
jgi:hypothetical protein